MTSFGLITEGPTDQIVIENILTGYFNNPDIVFRPLQPLRDETDKNRVENYGGWTQVFEYCGSSLFKEALPFIDYIIVQIDTDVSEEVGYDIPKIKDGKELTVEEIVEEVSKLLQDKIGTGFYNEYSEKIIFAISVDMIECWLLPLYYTDKRKAKHKNCLSTLNQALKKEGFTIDVNSKNRDYYESISQQYHKRKTLMSKYEKNPSFKIFIEEIEKRNIVIEE